MAIHDGPVTRAPVRREGYAPIRDYAVIGNKRTVALVALDGTIDWLCLPALDAPSAFGALLDSRRGGRFTLAPVAPFEVHRRYLPDTNVLETVFVTAGGAVRVTDALSRPVARPLLWNQVIRRIDGIFGTVPMRWSVEPRFDYGTRTGQPERRHDVPLLVHGRDVLAVQTFGAGEAEQSRGDVRGRFAAREGSVSVLALSAFHDEPLALSRREHLLESLDATGERWRRWLDGIEYDGPVAGRRAPQRARARPAGRRRDRRNRRGGDDGAARAHRRPAQLRLPLRLAARRQPDARGDARARGARPGPRLARLAAAHDPAHASAAAADVPARRRPGAAGRRRSTSRATAARSP